MISRIRAILLQLNNDIEVQNDLSLHSKNPILICYKFPYVKDFHL